MVWARMKPFSKSVWISPAACGAADGDAVAAYLQAHAGELGIGEDVPQQVGRRAIGPVQVVQHHQHGAQGRGAPLPGRAHP